MCSGFVKKQDIQLPGQAGRFLTVVSADDPDGVELMLEPNGEHEPTKVYKAALFEEGIPLVAFEVDDIMAVHSRLVERGVAFRTAPERLGTQSVAVFDDTCGNWIMIYQTYGPPTAEGDAG